MTEPILEARALTKSFGALVASDAVSLELRRDPYMATPAERFVFSAVATVGILWVCLLMAVFVIYLILGILYESFVHPLTILSGLPSAVLGALLFWITPFKAPQAFAMAFIAAGAGTLGELVMRALKKDAGVRFWGNRSSVTGAVGLLDRVAPLCFAAPVFFHAVRWYF